LNQLTGTIAEIHSCDGLSLIKVKTADHTVFSSLILGDTRATGWLMVGKPVKLHFKETEVMISTDSNLNISVQNRLPCKVHSLNIGEILGQVNLVFSGTSVCSIITANACRQLNLKVNDKVIALIKTNEISLSPDD
jgi:molybdopterin-binding protein